VVNTSTKVAMITGGGLAVGGLGLLTLSGYNVANPEVWNLSYELLVLDPLAFVEAARFGQDKSLFRGIGAVFGGVGVIGLGLISTSVFAITSSLASLFKRRTGETVRLRGKGIPDGRKKIEGAPDVRPRNRGEAFPKVNLSQLACSLVDRFRSEKDLDLEGEDSGGKIMSVGSSGSTDHVRMKRKLRDELRDVVTSVKEQFGIGRGDANSSKEKTFFSEAERSSRRHQFPVLRAWYEDAQTGAIDTSDLVDQAKKICDEWGEADFAEFASLDPINGAFITRLVKSWAIREDVATEEAAGVAAPGDGSQRERDREAMRQAMRALKKGEVAPDPDEEYVDLDAEDTLEGDLLGGGHFDDGGDDFYEEIEKAVSIVDGHKEVVDDGQTGINEDGVDSDFDEEMAKAVDLLEKSPSSENDGSSGSEADFENGGNSQFEEEPSGGDRISRFVSVVGEIKSFVALVEEVRSGEAEWPEYLVDDEERARYAEGLSSEMSVFDIELDDDVEVIVASLADEHEELEWLDENRAILSDGLPSFLEKLLSDSEDGDADPDGDLATSEAEETTEEEEGEEVESGVVEAGKDSPEELPSDDGDASLEDPDEGDDLGVHEDGVQSLEGGDVLEPEVGDRISEDVVLSEEIIEPRDVSIDPLLEMEAAGSAAFEWGKNCKKAGATEGSLARYIFEKFGTEFKTLGLAHVMMIWRNADADTRLNVILKKVPEGDWAVRTGEAIRIEERSGDFVEIPERFLSHPEIANNLTIVHLHGEGAKQIAQMEVSDRLLITSEVLSAEKIRSFISG